jgi:hypothetical protein
LLKPGAQPHSPIKPHGLHAFAATSSHWFTAHVGVVVVAFTAHS